MGLINIEGSMWYSPDKGSGVGMYSTPEQIQKRADNARVRLEKKAASGPQPGCSGLGTTTDQAQQG